MTTENTYFAVSGKEQAEKEPEFMSTEKLEKSFIASSGAVIFITSHLEKDISVSATDLKATFSGRQYDLPAEKVSKTCHAYATLTSVDNKVCIKELQIGLERIVLDSRLLLIYSESLLRSSFLTKKYSTRLFTREIVDVQLIVDLFIARSDLVTLEKIEDSEGAGLFD